MLRAPRYCVAVVLLWTALWGAAGLAAAQDSQDEVQVRAMSFNIRYGLAEDGDNHWRHRRRLVFDTLSSNSYDFVGLQEALTFQVDEITDELPQYASFFRTREADPEKGETCAILFRRDRWRLDRALSGTFWLSETPEVAGSKSWDSSLPRIATWARFEDRETGAGVLVVNTHFDHRGQTAREKSAELLLRRVEGLASGGEVLVMGDFNAGETNPAMKALQASAESNFRLVDSYRVLYPERPEPYTFNGWGERAGTEKIDGIFVRLGSDVVEASIERPRFDGRTPSDHDPVTAVLRLRVEAEEIAVEITDLGECRSCARGIERALGRLEGVLSARLHEREPRVVLRLDPEVSVEEDEIRRVVRDAGYTAGLIERSGL